MKRIALLGAAFAAFAGSAALLDDAAAERLARETLAKMTLDEKVSLTGGSATMFLAAVPRVGISNEWAMSDCSHAVKPEHERIGFGYVKGIDDRCTALAPLSALASTWNPRLAALHGRVMGEQMRARGKDMMLGPGVNMMRSPRCGRNWEYMGEDPYLAARLVVPLIRAVQELGVATTVKHFCVNNQERARMVVDTVVDERTLHEIYLPAFRAAVVEGGSLALMTACNKVDGVFSSENAYLLRGILRGRWGFKGLIVSDWGAQHSTVEAALNGASVEMDCGEGLKHFTNPYGAAKGKGPYPLAEAVRAGDVLEATVDEMAYHVLYVMAKTGFLTQTQAKGERLTERHRAAAREIGEEAVTLLKNEAGTLPLDRAAVKKLVLIGNQCDLKQAHLGCSCEAHPSREITPYAGLCEYLGKDAEVLRFPLGGEAGGEKTRKIDDFLLDTYDPTAKEAFVVRAWEETCWTNRSCEGAPARKGYAKYPELRTKEKAQWGAVRWTAKVRAPESGCFLLAFEQGSSSLARISMDGKLLKDWADGRLVKEVTLEKDRIYEFTADFQPGERAASGLFGWVPPSSHIASETIRAAAERADAVVVFTGTEMGYGRGHETEGGDRPDMREPVGHDEAIAELLGWKIRRLVVVNRSGSPMEMPWEPSVRTLVQMPYLGQEAGCVLAKVLFGEVNPSGKLSCTWPRRHADTPVATVGTYNTTRVVYNERFYVGYRWYDAKGIEPMFPFGFGRSYTTFAYGDLAVRESGGGWDVSAKVRNTGARDGKETAQLYVHAIKSAVERVEQELKGFDKVEVKAGGEATARMRVTPRDLAYYDVLSHRWRADAGQYELRVGSDSRTTPLRTTITLKSDVIFDE